MSILINGVSSELLPATDRGLQYGDGLFETVAFRGGRLECWQEHINRLKMGCDRLAIPCPDPEILRSEAERLLGDVKTAVLKIIITRGSGGRGYRAPETVHPTRILSRHPWPEYPSHWAEQGVVVRSCETCLSPQPRLAGLKHLNRLEQVLARNEWSDPGIFEGVMRDIHGCVVEGTMSNLFFVQNGRVLTADLSKCGVAGVVRNTVLQACEALGIPLQVRTLTDDELRGSEEAFITNSLIGVWPVRRWDDTNYAVPGPVTRRIRDFVNDYKNGS